MSYLPARETGRTITRSLRTGTDFLTDQPWALAFSPSGRSLRPGKDLSEPGIADFEGLYEQIGDAGPVTGEHGVMGLIRLLFVLYRLRFTGWWWQAKRFLTYRG